MSYYAVFLDLEGRPCTVIGGGEVLERKIDGLVRAGATVTVVSADPGRQIEAWADAGRVVLRRREFQPGDLRGAFLAIAWSEDPAERERLGAEARAERCLLNVIDVPERCDFIAPAILERGELQVAVSSSGTAPALAAVVRDRIARQIGPEYAIVARLLRRVREDLLQTEPSATARARILKGLAASPLAERVRERDRAAVERLVAEAAGVETAARVRLGDLGIGGG